MLQLLTLDYAHCVLKTIHSSSSSIDVLSYVVNFNINKQSDLAHLIFLSLKKFHTGGHQVRIILDYPRKHKSNYHCNLFSTRRFKEVGFDVRFLVSHDTQHAKLIIFDSKLAVFGSHNWTSRSVNSRFDISLLLDDPSLVKFFRSYFDDLWNKSDKA